MIAAKNKMLFRLKFRETRFRRHFKLFEGKSEDWIEGFIHGFAYFLFHGRNRHLQDIENIDRDLKLLKSIGVDYEKALPGEWWAVDENKD